MGNTDGVVRAPERGQEEFSEGQIVKNEILEIARHFLLLLTQRGQYCPGHPPYLFYE
mgnify:CR=1 FL=1